MNLACVTIELYLKSLASELKYVQLDDGVSIVHSTPVHGHVPVKLLSHIDSDVRGKLDAAFTAWSGSAGQSLKERLSLYQTLFNASRYPFEEGMVVSDVNLDRLRDSVAFLKNFVRNYPAEEKIFW